MAVDLKSAPRWVTGVVLLALLSLGVAGTCVQNSNKPAPKPSDDSAPARLDPSTVWRQLSPPSKNAVPGLELPVASEITAKQKFVIIGAKCQGPVRWLINTKSGASLDVLESQLTNSIMILPGTGSDTIVVLAYTVVGGVPSETAVTSVKVKGDDVPPPPKPDPGPGPSPPPPTKVSKLHVTFYLDYAKQTQAISSVINDPVLRKWLEGSGHKVHELSVKADLESLGLADKLQGKYPPLVILQAQGEGTTKDGTFIDVIPLVSSQQIKDAVTQATK